eukprot:2303920-Prymnesium_polylepis.1
MHGNVHSGTKQKADFSEVGEKQGSTSASEPYMYAVGFIISGTDVARVLQPSESFYGPLPRYRKCAHRRELAPAPLARTRGLPASPD